ncbi:MAG: DUF5060 domain-containing protein [Armatimonadetes bacterium]|nr:DUF5060 domain-containing protein [Armatimonadota bacterium]
MRQIATALASAFLLLSLMGAPSCRAQHPGATCDLWGLFETGVTNEKAYRNPFADVTLKATFVAPSGRSHQVEGFYDGGQRWLVRFMPDEVGRWRYQARFSDGTPGTSGTFQCRRGDLHGPLRVHRHNPLWFQHADGTAFYLRAFHLWRPDDMDEATLARTLDFLKAQGFNAIVGPHLVPPNRLPWARGASGKPDFSRFNLPVWRKLDRVLHMTGERGMVLIPFSIFGGTNGMPRIPDWPRRDLFLRYWVARWGGFWNATLQPTSEWEEGYSEAEILRIGARLRELDGGRHLISVHALKASSPAVQRAPWYDYVTVQDKLTKWNPEKYRWFVELYRSLRKPIFAHECLWEGNLYQKKAGLDVDNLRKAAWVIALCGGQINYADEVQPGGRAQRRGQEDDFSSQGAAIAPRGRFYAQLKILADLMQTVPFWRMTPRPELCSTGFCLAAPGREYVAYLLSGGKVRLDLSSAKGSLKAEWFDPRTGKSIAAGKVEGGQQRSFAAPDDSDWVLHLRSR